MLDDIISAIPLGFLLAFMPGAVFFALLETSVIKGFRAAVSLDLGVIIADLCFILIGYFATSALLDKLKDDPALFIFGGAILCLYGVISFIKTKKSYLKEINTSEIIPQKNNYLKLLMKGFFLNFINIGVLLFWLLMIVSIGPTLDNDPARIRNFFIAVLAIYFLIDLIKIVAAKSLNRYLTPFRIFWLKRIIAIIIGICGIVLVFKGTFPSASENLENQLHIIPENVEPIDPDLEGLEEFNEKVKSDTEGVDRSKEIPQTP
ncbi:LysE family translocator [Nonlabens xiamenensis]|uniref:LysE family translocator n=1 Tax=Nonlabens xiamenensis TaxID=2341043 RepID=UPI000F60CAFC|nr:LysE family transporter [Nonlabens xiamenensis]